MIKKLLGYFIVGLGLFNITFGYTDTVNCFTYGSYTGSCIEFDPGEYFVYGNYTNSISGNWNFLNYDNEYSFTIGGSLWNNGGNSVLNGTLFWNDGQLYDLMDGNVSASVIGFPQLIQVLDVCYVSSLDNSVIGQSCTMARSDLPTVYNYSVSDFIENFNGKNVDSYLFIPPNFKDIGNGQYALCGKYTSDGVSVCLPSHALSKTLTGFLFPVEGSQTERLNGYDFYKSSFESSPFTSSSGGDGDQEIVGIELGSNESAINYFEKRYGRNESICYAGIDNVTTNWGSSVSFQEGTGLNVFQVFSGIYNISPDINKVYVRLNSRLINYEQWFGRSGDPLYLSNYNSGTNQVDLYYDNLTFPFANNPVAVYFLSNNIVVHSEYSTMGSEIVSYCNIKINDGSFDDIIDQAVKNNITRYTEQDNKNNGLNSDGTKIIIDFSDLIYTGDAWFSSGVDIAFSGNTTLKNTLKEFFTTFDNALDGLDINTSNRILPTWLVSAFLFVVLFNFLRKRK